MCVVTLFCLVFNVRDRDRYATGALFRRLIDLIERGEWVNCWELIVQHLGDRSSKSGLTVVDVPDGADVNVRFCPLELRLCHFWSSSFLVVRVLLVRVF